MAKYNFTPEEAGKIFNDFLDSIDLASYFSQALDIDINELSDTPDKKEKDK